MHTWINTATLTKKRKTEGRFAAHCAPGLFFTPSVGNEVAFVPPRLDAPRRAYVASVSQTSETTFDIGFTYEEGNWPVEAEEALVGCCVLMKRADVPEEERAAVATSYEGFNVVDATVGVIGVVEEIIANPRQSLIAVKRSVGEAPVLVPFVDEIVQDIKPEAQTIYVDLPRGLLEL